MQASKSQDDLAHFDTFECLSCRTVIRESKAGLARKSKPGAQDSEREK